MFFWFCEIYMSKTRADVVEPRWWSKSCRGTMSRSPVEGPGAHGFFDAAGGRSEPKKGLKRRSCIKHRTGSVAKVSETTWVMLV